MKFSLLVLSAILLSAGAANAQSGRIAFTGARDGSFNICVIDAQSGEERQLTRFARAEKPSFSPDGRQIAFQGIEKKGDFPDLYVIDADGKNLRRVTNDKRQEQAPTWTRDGKNLVFTAEKSFLNSPLWQIALDGTGLKQITPGEAENWSDENPQFSSDGRKLAYNKLRKGLSSLALRDVKTGFTRYLVPDDRAVYNRPGWSPDGRQIAVGLGTSLLLDTEIVRYSQLSMIDLASGQIKSLFKSRSNITDPQFSPDGQWLVYGIGAADIQLYICRTNGQNARQLTRAAGSSEATWAK